MLQEKGRTDWLSLFLLLYIQMHYVTTMRTSDVGMCTKNDAVNILRLITDITQQGNGFIG